MPFVLDVAFASLTEPCVGATTLSESTCTRIPSKRSNCSIVPFVGVSAAVSVIAPGNALPVEDRVTLGEPEISVCGGLSGSAEGMNSETVPVTTTRFLIAAAVGGALDVKTKIPSDVFESESYSAVGA